TLDLILTEPVRDKVRRDLLTTLVERVRHVLEKHQAQHDVLVLRRVHGTPQLVRRLPQGVLELLHRRRARRRALLLRWHAQQPSSQPDISAEPAGGVSVSSPSVTPAV